jgi:hypothetical protein
MRHVKFFLVCLVSLIALNPSARADRAGFLIGTNLARLSTDPDIGASTDGNFMMAGFAEFEVNGSFSIVPGVRFIEKGADISDATIVTNPGSNAQVTRTARYFEIPLHFKYKFRDAGESFRPFVFLGPALGFKVGDSTKVTSRSSGAPIALASSSTDSIKGMDFAAEVGGGLELFFTEDLSAIFGATYSLGMLDINETAADWRTRGLQLYAGLGFTF